MTSQQQPSMREARELLARIGVPQPPAREASEALARVGVHLRPVMTDLAAAYGRMSRALAASARTTRQDVTLRR